MSDKSVNLDLSVLGKTPPGNLQKNIKVDGRQLDSAEGTPSNVGQKERRMPETSAIERNAEEAAVKPRGLGEEFRLLSLGQKIVAVVTGISAAAIVAGVALCAASISPIIGAALALLGLAGIAFGVIYFVRALGEAHANGIALAESIKECRKSLQNLRSKLEEQENLLKLAQGHSSATSEKTEALRAGIAKLEEQLANTENLTRQKVEELQKGIKSRDEQIGVIRAQHERELVELGESLKSVAEKMESSLEGIRTSVQDLGKRSVGDIKSVSENLETMGSQIQGKVEDLAKRLDGLAGEIKNLAERQVNLMREAVQKYEKSEGSSGEKVKILLDAMTAAVEISQEITMKSVDLQKATKDSVGEIKTFVSREIERVKKDLDEKRSRLESGLDRLYGQLDIQKKTGDEYQENLKRIDQIRQQRNQLKSESVVGRLAGTVVTFLTGANESDAKLREEAQRLDKEENELGRSLSILHEQLTACKKNVDSIKESNGTLRQDIENLQKLQGKLTGSAGEVEENLSQMEHRIESVATSADSFSLAQAFGGMAGAGGAALFSAGVVSTGGFALLGGILAFAVRKYLGSK